MKNPTKKRSFWWSLIGAFLAVLAARIYFFPTYVQVFGVSLDNKSVLFNIPFKKGKLEVQYADSPEITELKVRRGKINWFYINDSEKGKMIVFNVFDRKGIRIPERTTAVNVETGDIIVGQPK